MARQSGLGGGMTALRAALGAAAGGLEGRSQQQGAEAEKKRMADALARQGLMDSMAMEDREEARKDRSQTQRQRLLAGGYLPTGRDMPGATPRQPVSTETVDGQEFALYSTPRQLALQTAMEKAELEARFKTNAMTPYQTAMINQRIADRAAREKASAGDDTNKAKSAGISKIIGGAGRVLDKAREDEKAALTQLDRLDRSKPDGNRWTGTQEDLDKATAAWQVKVDAAQKRSDDAQAKVALMTPAYNLAATTNDTTGIGEAYRDRPPAPPSTRSFDLFSPASGAAGKEKMREDLWDSIKLQNPTLSDSAITARVKKEIP